MKRDSPVRILADAAPWLDRIFARWHVVTQIHDDKFFGNECVEIETERFLLSLQKDRGDEILAIYEGYSYRKGLSIGSLVYFFEGRPNQAIPIARQLRALELNCDTLSNLVAGGRFGAVFNAVYELNKSIGRDGDEDFESKTTELLDKLERAIAVQWVPSESF